MGRSRIKWLWAAGALVTLPSAFWYLGSHPSANENLVVAVAFIPVLVAVLIELREQWRMARESPDKLKQGSPVGNIMAWILAVPLALLLLYAVYRMIVGVSKIQ